jgi:hypothetical protein
MIFIQASSLVVQYAVLDPSIERLCNIMKLWFSRDDRGEAFPEFYRFVTQTCVQPAMVGAAATSLAVTLRAHIFGANVTVSNRKEAFGKLRDMAW